LKNNNIQTQWIAKTSAVNLSPTTSTKPTAFPNPCTIGTNVSVSIVGEEPTNALRWSFGTGPTCTKGGCLGFNTSVNNTANTP